MVFFHHSENLLLNLTLVSNSFLWQNDLPRFRAGDPVEWGVSAPSPCFKNRIKVRFNKLGYRFRVQSLLSLEV